LKKLVRWRIGKQKVENPFVKDFITQEGESFNVGGDKIKKFLKKERDQSKNVYKSTVGESAQ